MSEPRDIAEQLVARADEWQRESTFEGVPTGYDRGYTRGDSLLDRKAAAEITCLRAQVATAEQERTEMLAELRKRYVTDDIVKLVRYAMRDIAEANETICRLRGETDADADLKRFVHYVNHEWPMSPGAVSEIIDFAQGHKARAEKAESALVTAEAAGMERAAWQPIETAPKDGTEILLWRADAGVMLGRWIAPCDFLAEAEWNGEWGDWEEPDWFGADFYIAGYRISNDGEPTDWMPLSAGPGQSPSSVKSVEGLRAALEEIRTDVFLLGTAINEHDPYDELFACVNDIMRYVNTALSSKEPTP